ncbi:MAG: LysR family transcriptional regulator [Firmicutes bacterium]|nr:LysR family transcriptional regulator [Bacillota bacterium]
MELYQLEYFKAVINSKNFTKAASEMNVSQPTISIAINKLEKELEIPLLERKNKSIILTPFGKCFLERVDKILMEIDNIYKELADFLDNYTTVRLGIPFTLCNNLIPLIKKDFMKSYPDINVIILQKGTEFLEQELVLGNYDFCILCEPENNKDLQYVRFKKVELYACFSEKSPFIDYECLSPQMLVEGKLLVPEMKLGITKVIFDYLEEQEVKFDSPYSGLILPQDMLKLVEMDMGVSLLDKNFITHSNAKVQCCPLDPPLTFDLVLAWNKNKYRARPQNTLKSFLTNLEA